MSFDTGIDGIQLGTQDGAIGVVDPETSSNWQVRPPVVETNVGRAVSRNSISTPGSVSSRLPSLKSKRRR